MIDRSWLPGPGTRDRRALQIGGWILAPLLVVSFIVRPFTGALLERHDALLSESSLLAREYRAVVDLPGDRRRLASLHSQLIAIAPRLFDGGDAVTASAELARYVAEEAGGAGLHVAQVETETRLDSTAALRISFRARGDIVSIHAFLRAMEGGAKLVRVERIEIVRASDGDSVDGPLTFTALVSSRARSTLGLTVPTSSEDSP